MNYNTLYTLFGYNFDHHNYIHMVNFYGRGTIMSGLMSKDHATMTFELSSKAMKRFYKL